VLIGQYLMKQNLSISKDDMVLIQNSDLQLMKITEKIANNDQHLNDKSCIIQDILFNNLIVFNEVVHRLCLPEFLGHKVLSKLHAQNHCHLGGANLLMQFNTNFYSPRSEEWIKKLAQSCLFCRLNQDRKVLQTKGSHRQYKNELTPGKIWNLDILYMPRSSSGFRYILTLVEKISSYICAMPIRTQISKPVAEAFRTFLGIMPQMAEVLTDHGTADFSLNFTTLCENMGISHEGSTPRRSQSNGCAEIANKL
jgi:hypothetical protein